MHSEHMPQIHYQNINKWLSTNELHLKWSNLFWNAPWITNAQFTQVLNSWCGIYLGNYWKQHVLKQDISPMCNLCTTRKIDNCLHLLPCYKNKNINNPRTNHHNKAVHALANTLLAHPTTWCFILINSSKFQDHTLENTIHCGSPHAHASSHAANVPLNFAWTNFVC